MTKLWRILLNNLDTSLAVILSIVAAIYGVFGGSTTVLLSAIASTLGLLAYGIIRDRTARDELLAEVRRFQQRPSAELFFKDRSAYGPLQETLSSARHICFLGPSVVTIFSQCTGYLIGEKLNRHGATIQVLLLDPDSPAVDWTAAWITELIPENLCRDIERTLSYVEWMIAYGIKAGSIEVRLMRVIPNYSMVLIDPAEPNGRMFVEFIGYRSELTARPHIELQRKRDGEWYKYYYQQYCRLWEESQTRLTSQLKDQGA